MLDNWLKNMNNSKRGLTWSLVLTFSGLLFCANGFAGSVTPKNWKDITVNVNANHPIQVIQKITRDARGFKHLDIILSNKGTEVSSINSIEINIPIQVPIRDEMKVSYGSSSMGSRPILVHKVSEPQKTSYSYMYVMIQQAQNQYVFAGALSWRIFIPIITLEKNGFVVRSKGEGKQVKPGQSIHYEQIALGLASDWQKVLDTYGAAIAKENKVDKVKDVDYKGWATWDYYAYKFSDKDIYENVDLIKKLDPSVNLIQIDAGWYTQRGDFGKSRTDLPGGMKAIADRIKASGMTPGIWIDGFRANTDSEIFKQHPEYFLHDNEGKVIVQTRRPDGPDKDRVYLDYSHPGARAHMANSIRVITKEFGIPYIKIDFILLGLNSEILNANPKFKSIKPFDSSITDVERVRLGLETIRKEAGPKTYLLGCSAVFGPCLGLVDGMRTGGDISPRFEAFPERVLANMGNYYLNGKVFNGDADYLVFREAADEDAGVSEEKTKRGGSLTLNEAQMWADFNKLYGSFRLSSDKLLTLRPERKALIKEVFELPAMDEIVPLDFWQHAKNKQDGYELIIARNSKDIYLGIFNWSDTPKEYDLSAFGIGKHKLNARHSNVLKYTGSNSFAKICKALATDLTPKTP